MRSLRALAVAAPLLAAVPSSAVAHEVLVASGPTSLVPAAGAVTTYMTPDVSVRPGPEDGYLLVRFLGPDGQPAAGSRCDTGANRSLQYRGNGPYTVSVTPFAKDDHACTTPIGPPQDTVFTQAAGVTLTPPAGPVLIREAGSAVPKSIELPLTIDPGAATDEVRLARDGKVGPDGVLVGPSIEAGYSTGTRTTNIQLREAGTYTVVARGVGLGTDTGTFFTPWAPPVTLRAIAPFDLEAPKLTDARGPSYAVRLQVVERSTRGRVRLSYARGAGGGPFRSLGAAKLGAGGRTTKRFTIRRKGTYRLRVSYAGGGHTAAGTVTVPFTVS